MNTQISSLIEDQLPGFIVSDYENFAKVLEGYYQQSECTGQPLDIITNIRTYRDIDFYEKNLLKERTLLSANINDTVASITVEDATSFPERNGYIKIDDEVLFYKERTSTEFLDVSRGISGNTKLGDLYTESTFVSSVASSHNSGANVDNLSHLFLYAFTKALEKEYLESFPETYLKEDVDKRTLIKNISNFYKVKGNDKSIRFIFNTIVSKSADDVPTTYNPKDHTIKISTSDWDSSYALQAVILSGDPEWLVGESIVQQSDNNASDILYASAIVENIVQIGVVNDSPLYNIILNPGSINGDFIIPQQTVLSKSLSQSATSGDLITVDSAFGWSGQEGTVVINGEEIKYDGKSARQFTIKERGDIVRIHGEGDKVYSYSTAKAVTSQGIVSILFYGILTRLEIDNPSPLSQSGDKVQISKPGFETRDPMLYDELSQNYRWKVNVQAASPSVPLNPVIAAGLSDCIADISSIYEDDQYYYIATSSYPSTNILPSNVTDTLTDPQLLKLLPKETTTTTEIYSTPRNEVGVFVDGTIIYGSKDSDLIQYGPITKFNVTSRGSGYRKSPYVLVNGESGKASAILTGDTVIQVVSSSTDNYTAPPLIEITSGRNANLQAVVTSGSVSSLLIMDGGEYYSSPPAIIIGDKAGKGKFAEYVAVLSPEGKIVDASKVDGGKYYTQENITVNVIPDAYANPATANADIYEWVKCRYKANKDNIDDNGGMVVTNSEGEKHYGVVGNPKRLRVRLGDNITSTTFQETGVLAHSPIIGYAYDGHPIYGPYGHENPLDKNSNIVRMKSGYNLKNTRNAGPTLDDAPYPMGTFTGDYEWVADVQTGKTRLDRNNGRFCVTPEFPAGIYAYFLTIDDSQNPVFPYVVGDNFYSIPVASNYDYTIKQSSLPSNAKRLFIPGTLKNGSGEIGIIDNVSTGSISSVTVEDSQPSFTVGSRIYVDNDNTEGEGASGLVSMTYGNVVKSIESVDVKASLLTSLTPLYSFAGDTITQPATGATGELLRDTLEETTFVVRNVQGTFQPELDLTTTSSSKVVSSSSKVINLLLSQDSTYTQNATLSLVLKSDTTNIIASGKVLIATSQQNAVRILVESGSFETYTNYAVGDVILKSSDVSNTAGTEINIIKQLSEDIIIISQQDNIAILETEGDHDMAEGDIVNVEIDPDETITESTYWVRRKKFQELDLVPISFNGVLNDTGIGSSSLVGYGRDYVAGTYTNVELVFSNYSNVRDGIGTAGDVGNAKANITVIPNTSIIDDGSGNISSIEIVDAGTGYSADDILTINPNDVPRIDPSASNVTIDPTVDYLNESTVMSFAQRKFKVASADWTNLVDNVLPTNAGQSFQNDAGTVTLYYVSKDDATNTVEYVLLNNQASNITDQDTFNSIVVTTVFIEFPNFAPLPQKRFKIDGVTNPSYTMRAGAAFTLDAIPDHTVWIVHSFQTSTGSDGTGLVLDSKVDVAGVTNNGVQLSPGDPAQNVVFTSTDPGVYYYICSEHPEMVGTITVVGTPSEAIPLLGVHHIGLGVDRTDSILDTVYSLSEGDLLKVDDEFLKVTAINDTTRKVTFERGQNNSSIVNHPLNSKVTSYDPQYRFTFDDKIFGNDINDPRVISYDEDTHRLIVAFDFVHEGANNPREIKQISSFFDHSTPAKLVSISKAFDKVEKLQFSPDNTNFETNPVLQIQKFYFYKFDTSHPSMLGSYLDISTSPNYNIFTEEKEVGLIEPGNIGAEVKIRLGYGPNIGNIKRKTVNFISYYYFLTTEDIDTGGSYLSVREDPLAGDKNIIYTTDSKFVYQVGGVPQYDGTGGMRYSGRSIGKIASIALDNLGSNYRSLPIIKGVVPATGFKATVEASRNILSNKITELTITDPGQGYSKPEAVVSSGDGTGLKISLTTENGSVVKAEIINAGSDYTYTPSIDIIETDNKLFFESNDIGIPQSIKFIRHGSGYHNDNSIIPFFTSPYALKLSGFDLDAFRLGEKVEQRVNGSLVASGIVAKNGWKQGSNILRLNDIDGVFRIGYPITNSYRAGKSANIVSIDYSQFNPITTTRERQIGKFSSNRGHLNSVNQRITDSDFYQDYSYVIRSRTPIKDWRNAIKETTHPAGFKVFGEIYLESEASTLMEVSQDHTEKHTTYLVSPPVKISSLSTKRTITERYFTAINHQVRRGQGNIAFDEFDETLTRVRELTLSPAFNGTYDSTTGRKIGQQDFTIIDKLTGTAYTPYNEQELMITLDGIAQRPYVTYTVTGNTIKFYEAPLGPRVVEDQNVPPQEFYGRAFKFRDDTNNVRYLKRLKDISESFDGKQKNFDLYWEDGSIVKTDLNENLLLYLDSILQQDSYTIRRFVSANKTDRLIFKKAPKNYADLYSGMPDSLENEQYFYGQSVGSYERLGIDESLIPYNKTNSYLILDKNKEVKTFSDNLYAYVYVNGVLQQDTDSYRIAGPSIIFHKPLEYSQQSDGSYNTCKVDILYFYGKDYQPTLTCFDYERDVFFNRATINLTGAGTYNTFASWFGPFATLNTYVYQIIDDKRIAWGEIISVSPGTGNDWSIVLRSQNIEYVDGNKVYVSRNPSLNGADDIELDITSINVQYATNSFNERILHRIESESFPWLGTTDQLDSYEYRGDLIKEHPSIKKGDMIKIDGEFAYREIKSTPFYAKATNYKDGNQVSNSFFSKLATTEYNGDRFGAGFTVTATIENGIVTKLDWNRRDLEMYFKHNILLNPTAYRYYQAPHINLIPVDGNGGGAKAQVLTYGDQIIDIILVDGGSGYTKPPKAVIGRGYDIIRVNDTFESSAVFKMHANGYQGSWAGMSPNTVCTIDLWRRELIESIAIFVLPPITKSISIYGQTLIQFGPGVQAHQQIITKIITPPLPDPKWMEDVSSSYEIDIKTIISASYAHYEHPIHKHTYTGVVDMLEQPLENESLYTQGKLGTTVASFMEYLYIDHGTIGTGINIAQFEAFYPFLNINQGVGNWMENYTIDYSSITSNGILFNPGIPSMSNRGGFLDQDLPSTATASDPNGLNNPALAFTMHVNAPVGMVNPAPTSHFPATGKLLVGREVVRYSGTLNDDRFTISERGVDGTIEEDHIAGQYFRELGKYN